jgi:hypothetical protein
VMHCDTKANGSFRPGERNRFLPIKANAFGVKL